MIPKATADFDATGFNVSGVIGPIIISLL